MPTVSSKVFFNLTRLLLYLESGTRTVVHVKINRNGWYDFSRIECILKTGPVDGRAAGSMEEGNDEGQVSLQRELENIP